TRVLNGINDVRRVVRALVDADVRFTISTDGPEMLRTVIREELLLLLRHGILSLEEAQRAIETGHRASFLDRAPTIVSAESRRPLEETGRAAIPGEARS